MKVVIMNDGTEKTVTDKHARRLLYYKEAELKEGQDEGSELDEKEEKKTPANKKDKTKKETK